MAVPDPVIGWLGRHRSLIETAESAVMHYEARNPAWRHVRRGMHVLRLARSVHAAAMRTDPEIAASLRQKVKGQNPSPTVRVRTRAIIDCEAM